MKTTSTNKFYYNQFNTNPSTTTKMFDFLKSKDIYLRYNANKKQLWHELYHNTSLKHLFISAPFIGTNLKEVIVFAVNRDINCYIVADDIEIIKIKGLKATYRTDPDNINNLIFERVSKNGFYPDDLNKLIMEAEVQHQSLEDRQILRKELVEMKRQLNVEFPPLTNMCEEVSRDAEPFDIEVNYSRLPKTIVDHFHTDASIGQLRDGTAEYTFNGSSISEADEFDYSEEYINYIAEMWLTIQYYKQVGCTPNEKEYKQCSCGQWHHRIRTQRCPKCDALNTEYVETLVKDFLVELDGDEDEEVA